MRTAAYNNIISQPDAQTRLSIKSPQGMFLLPTIQSSKYVSRAESHTSGQILAASIAHNIGLLPPRRQSARKIETATDCALEKLERTKNAYEAAAIARDLLNGKTTRGSIREHLERMILALKGWASSPSGYHEIKFLLAICYRLNDMADTSLELLEKIQPSHGENRFWLAHKAAALRTRTLTYRDLNEVVSVANRILAVRPDDVFANIVVSSTKKSDDINDFHFKKFESLIAQNKENIPAHNFLLSLYTLAVYKRNRKLADTDLAHRSEAVARGTIIAKKLASLDPSSPHIRHFAMAVASGPDRPIGLRPASDGFRGTPYFFLESDLWRQDDEMLGSSALYASGQTPKAINTIRYIYNRRDKYPTAYPGQHNGGYNNKRRCKVLEIPETIAEEGVTLFRQLNER
jgi:hypothetical protein